VRPWLDADRSLERLNAHARARDLRTERGLPVRFVPPRPREGAYEVRVHETGEVETRPESWHDYFNALVWLAFPRAKARLNALHAAEIPREGGRRGRLRDLLTLLDEGGVLAHCDDPELVELLRAMRWQELFWRERSRTRASLRLVVFGHAVLEKAIDPWPGIACKAIIAPARADADEFLHDWLGGLGPGASPRDLGPLPVFGYPGWFAHGQSAEFYGDRRYFR
jgi:hypothetical protein